MPKGCVIELGRTLLTVKQLDASRTRSLDSSPRYQHGTVGRTAADTATKCEDGDNSQHHVSSAEHIAELADDGLESCAEIAL